MKHLFGQDWEISPAGGVTGKAYFAKHGGQQLFLKKNSSPFLAVLSAEGIVPKLIWTKRLENGDVVTAQHWLEGRELKQQEMMRGRVAKLMCKIHTSQPLLSMLERMGKTPSSPEMMLNEIAFQIDHELLQYPEVGAALHFLREQVTGVKHNDYVVCHGDVNHNNWLLSNDDQLYLIDWDGATIGDPAIDLGMLLYKYIDRNKWETWLAEYGLMFTPHLALRLRWYALAQTLLTILWNKHTNRIEDMKAGLLDLQKFLN